LTLAYDIDFQSRQAKVMTRTQSKTPIQLSVGSKDGIKTNGQTDTTNCFTFPDNAIGS